MGGCGISGLMYGKVEACDFLCHPYAADLIMLTVEVLSNSLEARPKPATCPVPHTPRVTRGMRVVPARAQDVYPVSYRGQRPNT